MKLLHINSAIVETNPETITRAEPQRETPSKTFTEIECAKTNSMSFFGDQETVTEGRTKSLSMSKLLHIKFPVHLRGIILTCIQPLKYVYTSKPKNNANFHLVPTPKKQQSGTSIDLLHRILSNIKNGKQLCKLNAVKPTPLHYSMLEKGKGHEKKKL